MKSYLACFTSWLQVSVAEGGFFFFSYFNISWPYTSQVRWGWASKNKVWCTVASSESHVVLRCPEVFRGIARVKDVLGEVRCWVVSTRCDLWCNFASQGCLCGGKDESVMYLDCYSLPDLLVVVAGFIYFMVL